MDEMNKQHLNDFNANYFTKDNFWDEASPDAKKPQFSKKGQAILLGRRMSSAQSQSSQYTEPTEIDSGLIKRRTIHDDFGQINAACDANKELNQLRLSAQSSMEERQFFAMQQAKLDQ